MDNQEREKVIADILSYLTDCDSTPKQDVCVSKQVAGYILKEVEKARDDEKKKFLKQISIDGKDHIHKIIWIDRDQGSVVHEIAGYIIQCEKKAEARGMKKAAERIKGEFAFDEYAGIYNDVEDACNKVITTANKTLEAEGEKDA